MPAIRAVHQPIRALVSVVVSVGAGVCLGACSWAGTLGEATRPFPVCPHLFCTGEVGTVLWGVNLSG